ncbi:MAG: secretin N-terminal domain-containing protein, partial [Armatimonadota bacterium]
MLTKRWFVCTALLIGLAMVVPYGVFAQEEPAKETPKTEAVAQPEKTEASGSKTTSTEAKKPAATSSVKKPAAKSNSTKAAKSATAVTSARQAGALPVVSRGPVTMNFRGADIDRILDFYGSILGLTVIKDPALTGTATIIAPKPISVEQAFEILNAYLDTRGYEAVRENGMLKVQAKQSRGPGGGRRTDSGTDTGANPMQAFGPGAQTTDTQTRVFQLKFAGAQSVSRVINELFRDTGGGQQNQQRIQQVLAQLGQQFGGRPGDQQRADRMRQVINRFMPMLQSSAGLGSARASFDNYSNSVVVTAPPRLMEQIQSIIEELDQQITPNLTTEVFTLQYVDCTEMQRVISSLLLATATGGASSGALRDVPFEMRVMAAARAGSAGAVSGQVVAHQETNSVIVTASPEQLEMVRRVVQKLDVKQELQSTTFVFPLARASANDVATILSSMFGRRGGTGGFGGFGGFGTQQQVRRRLDQQTGARSGFGAGARAGSGFGYTPGFTFRGQAGGGVMPFSTTPSANPLPVTPSAQSSDGGYNAASMMFTDPYELAVWGGDEVTAEDLAGEQGDLESQQMLAQFGTGGGAGTGTRSTARPGTSARTGRGPGGQLSQLADLLNNLIVVPDTNSNSLIISVDPAYVEILQEILRSLDVVPEQVMIEAIIVEATLDDSTKLGFNWQFTNPGVVGPNTSGSGTVTVQPPSLSGGLAYTLVGADFEAVLNALQSDHRFKVLSTPKIFTANNRQAQINISQQVPFITSQFVSPTGSQTTSFGFLDVGII